MSDHFGLWNNERKRGERTAPYAVASLLLIASVSSAWPQTPPSATPPVSTDVAEPAPPPELQPAPLPPEPPRENPGLINELGKLLKNPLRLPPLKTPQQAIDDFNATMKGDAMALPRVRSSMVTGRMKCVVASNGAPDCKAAADHLCRDKGFKDGKSVDVEATQTCPMKVLLSGDKSEPGACRTDNFVTRAMCQ